MQYEIGEKIIIWQSSYGALALKKGTIKEYQSHVVVLISLLEGGTTRIHISRIANAKEFLQLQLDGKIT